MAPHGTEMSTCRSGIRPGNQYSVQMYDSCVTSISDYASEVTGYIQYQNLLDLHTRAIMAYLGLTSCNVGMHSEVDWLLPEYRTQLKIIRRYNRLVSMDDSRLMTYLWGIPFSCLYFLLPSSVQAPAKAGLR